MGCGLQCWLQVGQLFGTLAIGGVAGIIAWRQWKTAQDKVKLDLFDRRFAVFMDARRLVSEAGQLGKITDPNLPNEVIARGPGMLKSRQKKRPAPKRQPISLCASSSVVAGNT